MRDLNDYRREEKREETMKDERMENNKACVTGRITSGFSYSHEIFGERFFRADILAQSDYHRQEKLERLERWQELYRRVMDERQCISLKQLAVSGRDLIADGMEPGKEVGRVLQQLLELVLEDPGYNTRERLLEEAKNILAG